MEGCGNTKTFRCKYHGWTFDLDGNNIAVQDRQLEGQSLAWSSIRVSPM